MMTKDLVAVPVTQERVLAQINIELTKKELSLQKLQYQADELEFSPEKIPEISEFLSTLNAIDKVTDEVHKEGKKPYLEGGRIWDAAKNTHLSMTDAVRKTVKPKFDKLCAEEERKKREAKEAADKEIAIRVGIENNIIDFSKKIAACLTNQELLAVERVINLEKSDSRKEKYGKYHEEAVKKYDEVLKPILKDQKEKITQRELLEKQIKEAEKNNDVEKIDELQAKKEKVEDEIHENTVKIQEEALVFASMPEVPLAEEVFADTKSRRTYTIEIADEKEAIKKAKDLLEITVNKEAANVVLKTLKDTGAFKNSPIVVLNGIRYTEIKSYK